MTEAGRRRDESKRCGAAERPGTSVGTDHRARWSRRATEDRIRVPRVEVHVPGQRDQHSDDADDDEWPVERRGAPHDGRSPRRAARGRRHRASRCRPSGRAGLRRPRARARPPRRRRSGVADSIRAASTIASVARNATSGCGWNIAAVLSTTGHATKKPSGCAAQPRPPGKDDRAETASRASRSQPSGSRSAAGRGAGSFDPEPVAELRRLDRRAGRSRAACSSSSKLGGNPPLVDERAGVGDVRLGVEPRDRRIV